MNNYIHTRIFTHPTSYVQLIIFAFLLFSLPQTSNAAVPNWTAPLSTRGRYIVDATGQRFKLKSGNWHGASGTWLGVGDMNDDANSHYGENSHNLPLVIQYVPINDILDAFEQLGINSIRFPFSNQMIHDQTTVLDYWVTANPQWKGLTPLQVYDACLKALTDRGFAVILNNHTNKSKWCCGVADGNERWNESQTTAQWVQDWVFMVNRYKNNTRVVGADLYNEVRRDVLVDPNWGWGNDVDWYSAAQYAADQVIAANPDILVIIEGINWIGLPVDGLPHSRPTLTGAYYLSHTVTQSNKLVYSAHFYGYTGPNHSGAVGVGETHDPRYRDLTVPDLDLAIGSEAAFVAEQDDNHFTRPVWISEFGVEGRGIIPTSEATWFDNFLDYLQQYDLDFAIWPLVGYLENNQGNGWALMNWDRNTGQRNGLYDGNDWRADRWSELINSTSVTGPIANGTNYRMLNLDEGDYIKSQRMLAGGDWDSGATKAACPDDLRLIGISHQNARGLCTDASYGPQLLDSTRSTVTVSDQSHVSTDWANSYTKLQCPQDYYVIGYSVKSSKLSTVVCSPTSRQGGLGSTNGRTLWFNQADSRSDGGAGGEFALSDFKGQCSSDEYIAGIAFTTKGNAGNPAAVYCRSAIRTESSATRNRSSLVSETLLLPSSLLLAAFWLLQTTWL